MNVGVPPIQVYPSRNLVKSSVAIIFQSFPPCLKIGGKLSPRNPVGRCQGVAMATSQIGNQISLKLDISLVFYGNSSLSLSPTPLSTDGVVNGSK